MSRRYLALVQLVASAVLLAACGGGSEESAADADVVIYGSCGNTPNYLSSVGGTRWKRFPLTVGIDLSSAPRVNEGNNAEIYLRAIQAGAKAWAVGNGIGEVNIVAGRDADIAIYFDGSLPNGTLGTAFAWPLGQYQKKGVVIVLNTLSFSNLSETIVFESTIRQVVLHEMGHALFSLGANGGHSPFDGDRMGAGGFNLGDALSQRDINSIREAYCRKL